MQLRVVIPDKVESGQCIRIRCPDGKEADLNVPDGLSSGDSFIVEINKNGKTGGTEAGGGGSDNNDNNNKNNSNNKSQQSQSSSSASSLSTNIISSSSSNNNSSNNSNNNGNNKNNNKITIARIIKKDVLYLRDFVAATIIGLMIGTSIVLGFLIGVLSVTNPENLSRDGPLIYDYEADKDKGGHYSYDPVFIKNTVKHDDLRYLDTTIHRVVTELDEYERAQQQKVEEEAKQKKAEVKTTSKTAKVNPNMKKKNKKKKKANTKTATS